MSEEAQAAHDAQRQRVLAALDSLPPYAREFFHEWSRCVQFCGRMGGADQTERFITDLKALLDRQWDAYKANGPAREVDSTSRGRGI